MGYQKVQGNKGRKEAEYGSKYPQDLSLAAAQAQIPSYPV